MGRKHEDGYSSEVEGYLVVEGERFRLAKTNGCAFVLADQCELPPGSSGELVVIVDGNSNSRLVEMPAGVLPGQRIVEYKVAAPF